MHVASGMWLRMLLENWEMPRPCTRPPQSTFEGHKCIETGPLYQIIKIMIVVRTARIDWQQKLLEDVFLLNLMQTIRSQNP